MLIVMLAFILGVVSGLRALAPIAVVSWAARLELLKLEGTPLAFLGYAFTPYVFTFAAIGELVNDKLPRTPSRTVPPQFIVRVVSGALVGAAVGASAGSIVMGLVAGAVGAVGGTLGGSAIRGKLAEAFGKDLPAALIEDVVAIVLAIVSVTRLA